MLPSLQLELFPPGEQQLLLRSCPLSPTCGKAQTSPPHGCTPPRGPCRSHSQGRPLGLTLERAQSGSGRGRVGTHHPPPLLCSLSPQPGIRNLTSKPQVIVGWTGWGEEAPGVLKHGRDALELRMGAGHGVGAFPGLSLPPHPTILEPGRGGREHSRESPPGLGGGLGSPPSFLPAGGEDPHNSQSPARAGATQLIC